MMIDKKYMQCAIALAKKARGQTSPNPMVGAVVVKDGRIIGEGFHKGAGRPHAEPDALDHCSESPRGATLYVTMEPCCHRGRTPPCTDKIIAAGIARVVIGAVDPNKMVDGKGIRQLREAGIEVRVGVEAKRCGDLNPFFNHYILKGTPFVTLKWAASLDGLITARAGEPTRITGKQAQLHLHGLRRDHAAIMVGIGTILADDPALTCRLDRGVNPLRIVCDTRGRLPIGAQVVQTAREIPTMVATATMSGEKRRLLTEQGVDVMVLPEKNAHIDLQALVQALGLRQIDSLLVEGGATLHAAMVQEGLWQRLTAYIGGTLLGGQAGINPFGGLPPQNRPLPLETPGATILGEDVVITWDRAKEV
jgi:diaminohydroxyphosphoribosylaminopyrimidine deaminase/5-amino-6-(5-phosphoribosylamino)uracil reductase